MNPHLHDREVQTLYRWARRGCISSLLKILLNFNSGRTEKIDNNPDPSWKNKFSVNFSFEERQWIKFEVYDWDKGEVSKAKLADQDLLGSTECLLAQVVSATGKTFVTTLSGPGIVPEKKKEKEKEKSKSKLFKFFSKKKKNKSKNLLIIILSFSNFCCCCHLSVALLLHLRVLRRTHSDETDLHAATPVWPPSCPQTSCWNQAV